VDRLVARRGETYGLTYLAALRIVREVGLDDERLFHANAASFYGLVIAGGSSDRSDA
jgi:hypothetical protein